MSKAGYYVRRLFGMNLKNMFDIISKVKERSGKNSISIFFDMVVCSLKYTAGYMDYYYFGFDSLNGNQRKTYVTRGINNEYIKKMNSREFYKYFDDKFLFNQKFKKYFGREFMNLQVCSFDEFSDFCDRNSEFIVKPLDMDCGRGVELIDTSKESDIRTLYERLLENKQFLVEEKVIQHHALSELYPYSVNTIRIVSIRNKDKTNIAFQIIRVGNDGKVVDNFHNGGLYAVIEDGVVVTDAIDKDDVIYQSHPMTDVTFKGFKIPYYDELIKLVIDASKVIPEVGFVGWDVAVTEKGPILIEGNHLPAYDFYQSKIYFNKDGIGQKPKFDKYVYGEFDDKN